MSFFQRSEEAMAQEQANVEKQVSEWGNSADMLYLQPGQTMVRILPPYSDAGVFFREVTRHRTRTASGGTFIAACPTVMEDAPCALCDKAQELKDSGDPVKMKFAKDNLKPGTRYFYNVLVYSAPADRKGQMKEFGKVYVMEAGIMTHRQIVSLDTDAMLGWADITNLNNGVNLIIKRTGSGLDTKYEVNAHGAGRSDVLQDLASRGFDTSKLAPVNLDELYGLPPEDKLQEVADGLRPGASPAVQPGTVYPVQTPQVQPVPVVPAPVAPVAPVVVPTPLQQTNTNTPAPGPAPTVTAPVIPAPPVPAENDA